MIRHCLIPRRIVGQLGYVQTKLLRDESGEIMGYCSPVLYQLRKGDARVPQERELQRHAQLVPSLPSRADDLDIGRLEGKIGKAHVCTPVTNAYNVCLLLLEKKKK